MAVRDRLDLRRFFKDLDRFMRLVLKNRQLLLIESLHPLIDAIAPIYSRRMDAAVDSLRKIDDDYLKAHGLTGPELQIKLAGFQVALGSFERALAVAKDEPAAFWLTTRRMEWVFDWAYIILGSLPGDLVRVLNELVQVVHRAAKSALDPVRTTLPRFIPRRRSRR